MNNRYYFQCTNGTWQFVYWNGSTFVGSSETCGCAVNEYQWFEIFVTSSLVIFSVERKDHAVNGYMSGAYSIPSLNGQSGALGMNCWVQTQTASAHSVLLDYWEAWDIEAIYGRLGNSYNLNHP